MSAALKALLASKVRSSQGCWTCRLRRKKCDEKRPVCDQCGQLEIACHFQESRPEWMDSGPKQREMAEKIKSQVKKQATQRRDRKYLDLLETGTRDVTLNAEPASAAHASANSTPECRNQELCTNEKSCSGTSDCSSPGQMNICTPPSSNESGHSPPEIPWHSELFPRGTTDHLSGPDIDVHFIMMYLDYVFPYLYPFYQPNIFIGGRGWVLDVLQSSKAVYHTAISLASYFFSVLLANGEEAHADCTNRMVDKLQVQLEMGLKELQKDVSAVNSLAVRADIRERLVVMQSVMQMLSFELATSSRGNWRIHLDAAIAVFLQIMPQPDLWTETLNALWSTRWPPPEIGIRRPFSTGQASMRFFTASLLFMDVMSSITLDSVPRLYRYQAYIMPACIEQSSKESMQISGPIFMNDFFGLHNSVLQLLADVSALDSWKKAQVRAGVLNPTELGSRGQTLEGGIKAAISLLKASTDANGQLTPPVHFNNIVSSPLCDLASENAGLHPIVSTQNNVWLLATLLYLYTVIIGWHPSHPDIATNVTDIKQLILSLPGSTSLRAMIWPLCTAGCLCAQEDEQTFRNLADRLGPLKVFGTMKDAADTMEAVWARRGDLGDDWDIAKTLNILGRGVMLV